MRAAGGGPPGEIGPRGVREEKIGAKIGTVARR